MSRPECQFGRVFSPDEVGDLSTLSPSTVEEHVSSCGAIVFRDFAARVGDFRQLLGFVLQVFTDDDDAKRLPHPHEAGVQTVTASDSPLNWHAEFGNYPLRPDVIAFYCEDPGAGGTTLVCDGVALWNELPAEHRRFFEQNRLQFTWNLTKREIASRFGIPEDALTEAYVEKIVASLDHVNATLNPDSSYSMSWNPRAYEVQPDGAVAFNANIFPGVYREYVPRLEDGREIPAPVIEAVQRTASDVALTIEWRPGDFAIVDNHRCLHARGKPGRDRKVYALFGYTQRTAGRLRQLFS